jgi:hypothetical protein
MTALLRQFYLFPQLPTEIRLKIWPLTLCEPRIVEIRTSDYPANFELISFSQNKRVSDINWVTKAPPPAALSVCRESRSEALKVYTLRIQLLANKLAGPGWCEVIYLNPEIDVVYANFKWEKLLKVFLNDVRVFDDARRGVWWLALSAKFFWMHEWSLTDGQLTGQELGGLILVDEGEILEPYWTEWDGDCVFVAPDSEDLEGWEKRLTDDGGPYGEVPRARLPPIEFRTIRRGDTARALIRKLGDEERHEVP